MKVYLDKDDDIFCYNEYVQSVEKFYLNSYKITYADGKSYTVHLDEQALSRLEDVMDRQANQGLQKLSKYLNKEKDLKTIAGVCGIVGAAASLSCESSIKMLLNYPIPFTILAGTVSLVCMIPAGIKLVKNNSKIRELKKIDYCKENKEILEQYQNYSTALDGVDLKTRDKIKVRSNPFSILNIDDFTKKDLEKIVDNIEREKVYRK